MTMMRYPVSLERAPIDARFEIAGTRAAIEGLLRAAGCPIPSGPLAIAASDDTVRCAMLGPRRAVVWAPIGLRERLGAALRSALSRKLAIAAVDVTGSVATFALSGAGVRDVLAQGLSLDLAELDHSPGRIRATDGWGIGIEIEQRGALTHVTVDATLAEYAEHVLRKAAGLPVRSLPGTMRAPPPPIEAS